MLTSQKLQTRALLATSYRGGRSKLDVTLTHTLDATKGKTLCGRVTELRMADADATDPHAPPTCPACLARDPRNRSGSFKLASLLQL
jgi:predicted GNAT family acetyltransferase